MVYAIEYSGRLCRPDGRTAPGGRYDLCFRLHPGPSSEETLWEERHASVEVSDTGRFSVVLGRTHALRPDVLDNTPAYLSTRENGGSEELCERLVLVGASLQPGHPSHDPLRIDHLSRSVATALQRTRVLKRHVRAIEAGRGPLLPLGARVDALETRLGRLDTDEGRVAHLEDELEDIVGPDGDLIDLLERIEELERRVRSIDRLAELENRLGALEAQLRRGT